jgi:ATP-dependent exoDNAse (exonuclease V) alpha subunit
MLEEHDRIVLTEDLRNGRLKGGDVGTIVHVHRDGEAFEVEFLALDGNTAAVATVPASRLRPVAATDLTHARVLKKVG